MLTTLRLAGRWFYREWRAGEWQILFGVIFIAVLAMTTLSGYLQSLSSYFTQQSAQVLGADVVIRSPFPISAEWQQQANALGLRTAEVWSYPTMVTVGTQMQIVNLTAVSAHYPLWGKPQVPAAGEIWGDTRLLSLLHIKIGQQVTIGAASFIFRQSLSSNVATLETRWIFAPRVLMRLSDVAATRTVLPGSRVEYQLLCAGSPSALKKFRRWLQPRLQAGQQIADIKSSSFVMQNAFQQLQHYLQLTLLGSLAMAGIAILLASRRYAQRMVMSLAIMRCLGASRLQLPQLVMGQLCLLGWLASTAGIMASYGAQFGLTHLLAGWLPLTKVVFSAQLWLIGYATGILLLLLFSIPLISCVANISPLWILRRQEFPKVWGGGRLWLLILGIFLFFALLLTGGSLLILFFCHVMIFLLAFNYIVGSGLLRLASYGLKSLTGALRMAGLQFVHDTEIVIVQLSGFTLLMTLGLMLLFVQQDLWHYWQRSLAPQTPNYFAVNIAPAEVPVLQQRLQQQQVTIAGIYPMVRGRLIALNGKPILNAIPSSAKNNNVLRRELNLSWMSHLPPDNHVVQGEFWSAATVDKPYISIEAKLADELNLQLGDQLSFRIGSQTITGTITNMRELKWTSLQPNFYIIFPPGLLNAYPTTYITSFHLGATQTPLLNILVHEFPSITIIDIAGVLHQVQALLRQMALALQILLLFTSAIAILALLAGLLANMEARLQTIRLWRILGATRKFIWITLTSEFLTLAIISSLLAWILANLMAMLMSKIYFSLPLHWQWNWLGWSLLVGISGITLPALLFYRRLLQVPPLLHEEK